MRSRTTRARSRVRISAQMPSLRGALAPIAHGFTHFALTLHPQRMRVRDWPATAESPGRMWLGRDDALGAALPAPIRKLLQSL